MRSARLLGAAALTLAFLAPAACSGNSGGASTAGPTTLNVWLMKDSAPDSVVTQINQEFQAAHPNVTVKVQILDWDGRDVKWKTALASDNPPDAMEMGNTDVLSYAASGALADLSGRSFENKATWLTGLTEAGSYDGKLYGAPYYGGDRVVIYRKDLWAKAGLSTEPTTLAQLQTDAVALMATGGANVSGLYFPGRYQYAALPFVYDTGGQIAVKQGTTWVGRLSAPAAQQGLTNWLSFVKAASRAPADADETNLPDVMGQGHTAMIIGQGWMLGQIGQKYPAIKDQLAAFAMPGTRGPMPVFLGGSNLAVAAASRHADLGYEWVKLMTGTKYQTVLGGDGLLPNSTSLSSAVSGITAVEMKAATRSFFTPLSTSWSNVDNANVIQDMLQSIASGRQSVAAAAQSADARIGQLLNAG
jgi:N,N'-diacetylchitobiose transport system substrate-binding protein